MLVDVLVLYGRDPVNRCCDGPVVESRGGELNRTRSTTCCCHRYRTDGHSDQSLSRKLGDHALARTHTRSLIHAVHVSIDINYRANPHAAASLAQALARLIGQSLQRNNAASPSTAFRSGRCGNRNRCRRCRRHGDRSGHVARGDGGICAAAANIAIG